MRKDIRNELRNLIIKNAYKYDGKASEKAVLGMFLSENKEYTSKIKEIKDIISEMVEEINSLEYEEIEILHHKIIPEKNSIDSQDKKGLPDLPNVDKFEKVIMRLAPYPSGPLHIGNARMVILNDYYVKV
jgi:glutamyl-tRNA synthetase